MYISEDLQQELDFFKRTNEHFEIEAGKSSTEVKNATNEILYMAMSASLVMDYSEDGFFENFVITDKSISGRSELQIDAYALIETESSKVKQLHIFQYKLYANDSKSASPVELLNFATFVNNNFVHPEFLEKPSDNEVVAEIKTKCDEFLKGRRDRRIIVYCHYINNATGIYRNNEKEINNVLARFNADRQLLGFSIQVYGVKEILELAREGKIQVGSESLELVNEGMYSYRLEDNSKRESLGLPKKVIVGMCNVNEFIRLQNKYHHNQLYAENIRLYLGDRGNVNKDIIATITSSESLWFPYMNNGISIICDSLAIGNTNAAKHVQTFTLENMQIINGCQTVNALYSAKYGENTRDNFRPANVMVRIYEINPSQTDFKMNIIKATNNQNSVKSYSLMANDPIQIRIAEVLKKFNIIYDRKGEGKNIQGNQMIISMVNVALAYRAVYLFMARSLRSGLGKSRVFQKAEYDKIFNSNLLEEGNEKQLDELCFKFIIANGILDAIREQIQQDNAKYLGKLPIFKKSTYYLAGYMYASRKTDFDTLQKNMTEVFQSDNEQKLRGMNFPNKVTEIVKTYFDAMVTSFIAFYNNLKDIDKTDIDNLLKNKSFDEAYKKELETKIGKLPDIED
ncbi:AIPR family protein [Phocaeicola barnesiae]|uniref:AIPR family protein n=1 Tax=Phocaeicola barnesiae TaxID=376804 RepID=UPI0025A3F4F3|nr:AIPR family protein [Phocaeicola barnesiae]MDM8233365.1 AIPR family protein [Phocaeicola barnesiae]